MLLCSISRVCAKHIEFTRCKEAADWNLDCGVQTDPNISHRFDSNQSILWEAPKGLQFVWRGPVRCYSFVSSHFLVYLNRFMCSLACSHQVNLSPEKMKIDHVVV
jgi:hypothetical protein